MHTLFMMSGLGVNQKIFKNINFPKNLKIEYLPWKVPNKNDNMESYAMRYSKDLPAKNFSMLGVSFGGLMVQEISRIVQPDNIILISSIVAHSEKPFWMKILKVLPFHKILPGSFFTNEGVISYSCIRKLSFKKLPLFHYYFTERNNFYISWSINQIIKWKGGYNQMNISRFHGEKDSIFPHKNIKGKCKKIEDGNHFMILQNGKELSMLLKEIFKIKRPLHNKNG